MYKLEINGVSSVDYGTLHKKAEPVTSFDSDLLDLAMAMKKICYDYGGIGLAANQVGSLKRVIYIHTGKLDGFIVNPVITSEYGGFSRKKEGCISFPMFGPVKVKRHKRVTLEGYNIFGESVVLKLGGLAARVAQHEIDHLYGFCKAGD